MSEPSPEGSLENITWMFPGNIFFKCRDGPVLPHLNSFSQCWIWGKYLMGVLFYRNPKPFSDETQSVNAVCCGCSMSQITCFCVTLSVFNYGINWKCDIVKCWKSLVKGLHGKSLWSLRFGFTPLMKPSFITFNCNILSRYGLDKSNLMGRPTKFQVMLASWNVLCCLWHAFYHNVYFLVLDEWVKNCKCFQAVCQLLIFFV